MLDSKLHNNLAHYGGVLNEGTVKTTITFSDFQTNSAKFMGGVLLIIYGGVITISNSRFSYNSAKYGGVVVMDGASYPMVIIISATSIVGNVADKGAVTYTFTHGGEVVFNSSEVTLNTAITSGVILASHITQQQTLEVVAIYPLQSEIICKGQSAAEF